MFSPGFTLSRTGDIRSRFILTLEGQSLIQPSVEVPTLVYKYATTFMTLTSVHQTFGTGVRDWQVAINIYVISYIAATSINRRQYTEAISLPHS